MQRELIDLNPLDLDHEKEQDIDSYSFLIEWQIENQRNQDSKNRLS